MSFSKASDSQDLPVVWVVGYLGFLGVCLCETLLAKKTQVFCLGDWHGKRATEGNLKHLLGNPNFKIVSWDKNSFLELPKANYVFILLDELGSDKKNYIANFEQYSSVLRAVLQATRDSGARVLLTIKEEELLGSNQELSAIARFAESFISGWLKKHDRDARVVRTADLYGPRMPLDGSGRLGEIFKARIFKRKISQHSGLLLPIFIKDAVDGIMRAMFGASTSGRVFYFDAPRVEARKFANMVHDQSQIIELGKNHERHSPTSHVLAVLTPISVGVNKTLEYFEAYSKLKTNVRHQQTKKIIKAREWSKFAPATLFAFGGLAVVPAIFLFLASFFVFLGVQAAQAGNFSLSQKLALLSAQTFSTSREVFDSISFLPWSDNLARLSYAGRLGSGALYDASNLGASAQNVLTSILGEGSTLTPNQLEDFGDNLERFVVSLAFLKAQAASMQLPNFSGLLPKNSLLPLVSLGRQLPDLFGYNTPRTYLVLFQNNMELRPTGGFIGSFGLLTFDSGRLVSLDIKDVYEADGHLGGFVEPPLPIKEHLGEASWYLRDSNWSPDFATSAVRASWFLDKELGKKVDGVIGIDLETAKGIVALLGEVKVSDFDETITAGNLYEKTQKYAEEDFFPGSTKKRDFLVALNRAIMAQLVDKNNASGFEFMGPILRLLETRHIAIFLTNEQANQAIQELGWDGGIKSAKCASSISSKCLADYLMVVDANLGVNKANYYLSRSFLLDTSFLGREAEHRLVISYVNESQKADDEYKNYLRVYLPKESNGFVVEILDADGRKNNVTWAEEEEKAKKVLGFLVEVPQQEERQVTVFWKVPATGEITNYKLLWQKQAGVVADTVILRFYQKTKKPLPVLSSSTSVLGLTDKSGVGYTTNLVKDLEIEAKWTDKN